MNSQLLMPIGFDHQDIPLSVLIVEDLPDAADSLALVLSLCGFSHVVIANTGEAALERAADNPPDVVLLDIGLPDLNGWEVARWLQEQVQTSGKRALVVAVTGYGTADARRRSVEAGVDLHLVKPVDPAILVGVLRRFAKVLTPGLPMDADECVRAGASGDDDQVLPSINI